MDPGTANRFAPPVAAVEDVAAGVQPLRLWPPRGRIGRARFLVWGAGVWLLASLFGFVFGLAAGIGGARPEFVSIITGLVSVFVIALVLIQRSHDMDLSGWMSLLTVIPFVGLYWLFKRGTAGANRFGAPPPPNSTVVIVFAWLFGVLMVLGLIGMIAAIAVPLYFVSRAAQ